MWGIYVRRSKLNFACCLISAQSDLSKPANTQNIDNASGVLIPFFDNGTKMLYLVGKVSLPKLNRSRPVNLMHGTQCVHACVCVCLCVCATFVA